MSIFKGKNIYITGASRGIGRSLALVFAKDGARLSLCARNEEALRNVREESLALGAEDVYIDPFDLRDEDRVEIFYKNAVKHLGIPDILINNAGFNSRKAYLWEYNDIEFDDMFSVNVRAGFILMKLSFLDMKEKRGGHIVNILSTACHFDNERMSIYTATKKAFQGLTDVFRKEARPYNIRVTGVYPGGIDTGFRKEPRPDYMKPESVAKTIYNILSVPDDVIVHDITFRPMVETNF
jgi:NAD(P)-dependent dehydrogenase (short-subunit alcohol dehydrogenase family)